MKLKMVLLAVVLIAVIAGALFLFGSSGTGFFSLPNNAKVVLLVDEGTVQFDSGSGWQNATSGMTAYVGYRVKTLESSKAALVLFDNSVIRLNESTEITLKEIVENASNASVVIEQVSGQTWSQILKLSGMTTYEIETPTTVATVRGTNFGVNIIDPDETDVVVGKGAVNVSAISKTGDARNVLKKISLKADEGATISKKALADIRKRTFAELKDARPNLKPWLERNSLKDTEFIQARRQKIKEKIGMYINIAKDQYNVSDEQINSFIESYLRNEIDVPSDGFASKAEAELFVRRFLKGEVDPVTAASKMQQIQQIMNQRTVQREPTASQDAIATDAAQREPTADQEAALATSTDKTVQTGETTATDGTATKEPVVVSNSETALVKDATIVNEPQKEPTASSETTVSSGTASTDTATAATTTVQPTKSTESQENAISK